MTTEVCAIRASEAFRDLAGELAAGYIQTPTIRAPLIHATIQLRQRLKLAGHDLVHAHEILPALVGGSAARASGVPSIFHRHHATARWRGRAASHLATRLCDTTATVSEAALANALREGADRTRSLVLLGGVAPPSDSVVGRASSIRRELGIGATDKIVGCIGRLRHEKGQDIAIRSHERLARDDAGLHLILVGDGPERPALESLIAERRIPRVHLVGHVVDPFPWYEACDVIALPSRTDSLPLTGMEAMACGRPIVGMRVGGIPELISHGVHGWLVDQGDAESFAAALSLVLQDHELRRNLGSAASRRYNQTFTIDAMLDRWVDLYRSLASAGRSQGSDRGPGRSILPIESQSPHKRNEL